jgi:hypothetical protein
MLLDAERPSRCISRASAKTLVEKMTGCFEARSVVCMHMFNDVLYIPLFLAIIASQATWTGTNPAYTSHELSNHLNKTKARYLVVEQTHLKVALEAASRYDDCLSIVIFEDLLGEMETAVPSVPRGTRAEVIGLSGLITRRRPACEAKNVHPASHSIFAALMSTSGTTGSPKLACRTQRALMAESIDSLKDSRVTFKHLTRLKISGYGSQKNICDTGILKISETATNLQSLQLTGTPWVPASTVLALAQASHKTIRLLQYRPQDDSTLARRSSVLDDQPHLCQQVSALTELRDLDISLVSLCSSIFCSDKAQWSGQCIIRFESFCPSTNSADTDRTKSMTKILAAARCLMAERIRFGAELSIELSWGARVFDVRAGTVCYESGRTAEEPAAYRLGETERDLWLRGSKFSDREKLSRLTVTEDEFLKAMRYDDITSQQSIKAT